MAGHCICYHGIALYGMTVESLLFRGDWKQDNAVTRRGHSFNEELSPWNLQKVMFP